jgi:S1-C subfamily serine protease
VKDPDDLSAAVLDHEPGERIELTVVRGGDERTIDVRLGTRPEQVGQG